MPDPTGRQTHSVHTTRREKGKARETIGVQLAASGACVNERHSVPRYEQWRFFQTDANGKVAQEELAD